MFESRRNFFKFLSNEAADVVKKIPFATEMFTDSTTESIPAEWHPLGKLSEYPPGTKTVKTIGNHTVQIISDDEGIAGFFTATPCALRLSGTGMLEINLKIKWPINTILSILTLEMTERESVFKEQNNER